MKCGRCGAENDRKKLFCESCGAPLHLEKDILPLGEKKPPEKREDRKEAVEPEAEEIRRRLRRAWIIRIIIAVAIIAILILVLLLLANSRKAAGAPAQAGGDLVLYAGNVSANLFGVTSTPRSVSQKAPPGPRAGPPR